MFDLLSRRNRATHTTSRVDVPTNHEERDDHDFEMFVVLNSELGFFVLYCYFISCIFNKTFIIYKQIDTVSI